ncbi:sulfur carrier protein ThiS [Candidatus Vondammii sp. HM_W22]|uniref:sulfur carrier protein ThiS n=1 Tax=Candidatus Vondammii sp. HM_W22 TaxID=2687299 RepID=UPI001F142CE8|nr:sulfur carrier protein ThiS [Candidatus Vondammii sp. HM_W22]
MQIYINSEGQSILDNTTMASLIELLALTSQRIAVEVNGELVPRSTFEQHQLQPDDKIEIVRAIGGG